MSVVVFLVKLAVYAVFLNVLVRQSYNLFFFWLRKPVVWIIAMAVIGFANFATAGWIGSSVSLPFWATAIALVINVRPRLKDELAKTVDEVYLEWGIIRGRLKYRLGLFAMAISSLAG